MSRAYQPDVANPKTLAQIKVRNKFATISMVGKALAGALALGFKEFSDTRVSARNLFAKNNQDAVAVSSSGAVQVAYDELNVAKGSGVPVEFGTVDMTTPGKMVVPIADKMLDVPGALNTDRVVIVAYDVDYGYSVMSTQDYTREKNEVQVILPSRWATTKVHAWGFTYQQGNDGVKVSASTYLGEFTVA